MANVKAVLLDCDGTIVRFKFQYIEARREVIDFLVKEGLPKTLFSVNDYLYKTVEKMEVYLNAINQGDRIKGLKKGFWRIVDRYELKAAEETCLVDGAKEALTALRLMGMKIALVTNNGREAAEYIVNRFSLKGLFDAIVARDDVELMKPNPEHVAAALKKLKVGKSDVVLVGDSVIDMEAAYKAGITSIAVESSIMSKEGLRRGGAKYIIPSICELPNLLRFI